MCHSIMVAERWPFAYGCREPIHRAFAGAAGAQLAPRSRASILAGFRTNASSDLTAMFPARGAAAALVGALGGLKRGDGRSGGRTFSGMPNP
jgi:hypothetical protein